MQSKIERGQFLLDQGFPKGISIQGSEFSSVLLSCACMPAGPPQESLYVRSLLQERVRPKRLPADNGRGEVFKRQIDERSSMAVSCAMLSQGTPMTLLSGMFFAGVLRSCGFRHAA